ncbi:MAG: alpha/beta hydrolase [Saprospiraceae bacterium]|nr:alpha/beta hydrolase [Saprospiraceae bacterium]
MKIIFYAISFIWIMAESAQPILAQANLKKIAQSPLSIGQTLTLHSAVLQEERVLNIYLPLNYNSDSSTTYPVIYLLDGSIDEDFIHIAGLVQFGSFSWINMLPQSIIVGIANVNRKRDFTFPLSTEKDQTEFPGAGHSEKFIQFLEQEIKPFIQQNYKINNSQTIIGQSLGGLLATEILLKHPTMFNRYIIISPSLWWDNQSLLQYTNADFKNVQAVYIGVGDEGKIMRHVAKKLYKKLKKSAPANLQLHYQYFPKHDHGDILHQAAYAAFEWMFQQKKEKNN